MVRQSNRVGRIALEECIRCVALEVVIGLPPLGIVQGLGISERKLGLIAAISLPVPILISIFLFFRRVRRLKEGVVGEWRAWRMTRDQWFVLLAGAALALIYGVWLYWKGLMSSAGIGKGIAIMIGWIVLGLLFVIKQQRR